MHFLLPSLTVKDLNTLESTEFVLFLILTFAGCAIRNYWTSPLVVAIRTIRELVQFVYIASIRF